MNEKRILEMGDRRSAHGFSLIEVMIALCIFSVGLLAIWSMHLTSIKGNASARGITDNVTVAAAKVEQLMALAYNDLVSGSEVDGNMNVDWQVQDECLGAVFQGHKCVQVHVSSTVNGKQVKEVRLDFVKANIL